MDLSARRRLGQKHPYLEMVIRTDDRLSEADKQLVARVLCHKNYISPLLTKKQQVRQKYDKIIQAARQVEAMSPEAKRQLSIAAKIHPTSDGHTSHRRPTPLTTNDKLIIGMMKDRAGLAHLVSIVHKYATWLSSIGASERKIVQDFVKTNRPSGHLTQQRITQDEIVQFLSRTEKDKKPFRSTDAQRQFFATQPTLSYFQQMTKKQETYDKMLRQFRSSPKYVKAPRQKREEYDSIIAEFIEQFGDRGLPSFHILLQDLH